MTSSLKSCSIISRSLVLALLAWSSDAFVPFQHSRAHITPYPSITDDQIHNIHTLSNASFNFNFDGRSRHPERERALSRPLFAGKNDGGSNSNNMEEKKYTKVEDGSPLGVAIVLIGSLIIFGSEDGSSLQSNTSPSVWIVFATASTAAGLARLFRYFKEKNE